MVELNLKVSLLVKNMESFQPLPLAPLQGLPFAAPMMRTLGEERLDPRFFQALLGAVGQADGEPGPFYPWTTAPQVWGLDRGQVLLSGQGYLPLDITPYLHLTRLEDYGEAEQSRADFIYAGETYRAGQKIPVLVAIGELEPYLREQHLNRQGPEGQELSVQDYLAEVTSGRWETIRTLGAVGAAASAQDNSGELLADLNLLAAAQALASWHTSHLYDPATGQPTLVAQAGWSRISPRGAELFPRTDPAVITAVTAQIDGQEKLLLGSARAWEEHRYSTFAGFVEAGESLENAVIREVWEECGGQVEALAYRASQPWPFPRSLMLGYTARISNPHSVTADGQEIRSLRWFTRQELTRAEASGEIILPSPSSISRALIDDWLHHTQG